MPTKSPRLDPFESAEYKCYREDLAETKTLRLEIFKIFATYSLGITTGIIVSIGFIIKEFSILSKIWILVIASFFAVCALLAALFELVFSQVSTTHLEKKLTNAYKGINHSEDSKKINYYADWCLILLYTIPWLITFSVLSIGLFLFFNITNLRKGEQQMSDEKTNSPVTKSLVTDSAAKPNNLIQDQASIVTDGPSRPKDSNPGDGK